MKRDIDAATEEELKANLASRLAKYKALGGVTFVPDIPWTASGKLQKFKIKRDYFFENEKYHGRVPGVQKWGLGFVPWSREWRRARDERQNGVQDLRWNHNHVKKLDPVTVAICENLVVDAAG